RALLDRGAHDAATIADDAPAEMVAPALVVCDIWTTWRSMSAERPALQALPRAANQSIVSWLAEVSQQTADEATARVANYLAKASPHEAPSGPSTSLRAVDVAYLSRNTGLPSGSVQRVLKQLERDASLGAD